MGNQITLTLRAPAKINGRFCQAGEQVTVDVPLAQELDIAGIVAPLADGVAVADLASGAPGFDEAVAHAAKELAEGMLDAVIAEAIAPLEQERDALRATIRDLQADAAKPADLAKPVVKGAKKAGAAKKDTASQDQQEGSLS